MITRKQVKEMKKGQKLFFVDKIYTSNSRIYHDIESIYRSVVVGDCIKNIHCDVYFQNNEGKVEELDVIIELRDYFSCSVLHKDEDGIKDVYLTRAEAEKFARNENEQMRKDILDNLEDKKIDKINEFDEQIEWMKKFKFSTKPPKDYAEYI